MRAGNKTLKRVAPHGMGVAEFNPGLPASSFDAGQVPQSMWSLLRAWYLVAQRELPWRAAQPDPYRVWVSEVMSQQTGLSVVLPYFERFVTTLPNLESLACASEVELRRLWAGLGYYSRAVRLQQGAQMIRDSLKGRFPDTYEAWLEIPGCGPYTAAAVASICFDQPIAVVDGNVVRVVSRLLAWDGDAHAAAAKKNLQESLSAKMPRSGPGLYNQALMELGALVCKPRQPRCSQCPLETLCLANRQNRVHELPRPKPRRQSVCMELVALVLFDETPGRVALLERHGGLLSGTQGFVILDPARASQFSGHPHVSLSPVTLQHSITHHRLRVRVMVVVMPHSTVSSAGGRPSSSSGLVLEISESAQRAGTLSPFRYRGAVQWRDAGKLDTALSSSLDQKVWRAARQTVGDTIVLDSGEPRR